MIIIALYRTQPLWCFLFPDYSESNAIFCKVDVDKAGRIAQSMGVTSMPSFKIVKNAVEVICDFPTETTSNIA